ncbi:hypothetical protein [Vibrio celticus]|uniref:Uncharacterized protein n=1 Tax=Vibrio celticus TaxID=446372 RepID=A0A1C3JJ42_9VIBR|nr:hypothetical protein [Vibrio celticus]SBT15079.1 hypothetical protein VCE7224_03862 [Vibrio celticus]
MIINQPEFTQALKAELPGLKTRFEDGQEGVEFFEFDNCNLEVSSAITENSTFDDLCSLLKVMSADLKPIKAPFNCQQSIVLYMPVHSENTFNTPFGIESMGSKPDHVINEQIKALKYIGGARNIAENTKAAERVQSAAVSKHQASEMIRVGRIIHEKLNENCLSISRRIGGFKA